MKYLLYCIVRTRETRETDCPPGVDGHPVFLVGGCGLSAVTSSIAGVDLTPNLPRILAYEKVVEVFHRADAVIPMRYGCLIEGKPAVTQLIEERRRQYEEILEEVDGCEELGIRMIPAGVDSDVTPSVHSCSSMKKAVRGISRTGDSPFSSRAGHAYLAAQMERYAARDRLTHEEKSGAERVRAHFSGLFVRDKIECSALAGNCLTSLYFLVPRESVPAFRTAFRHLCSRGIAKFLLSGPWPPYNFTRLDRAKPRGEAFAWRVNDRG